MTIEIVEETVVKIKPQEIEIQNKEITITYGYSRDHRPDLKQLIIEMICSADGDIPIFVKLASGNQADSSCFGKIAIEYHKQLIR